MTVFANPTDAQTRAPGSGLAAMDKGKLAAAIACGIAAGYAAILINAFLQHVWIIDAAGHPIVNDYVVFWTVGHQALRGLAAATYNEHAEHAAELASIGHRFDVLLGWSYPPPFLFVVSALASLPYVAGFLFWGLSTLALQAGVVSAIAKRRAAFFVACAAPWVAIELILGQNGFLTAALIGLVLLHLEKRQILSGLLLGLLIYKPQFGVLFPLALAAGGYWRAFVWAAASAIAVNLAAGAAFGFDTFAAFLHALSNAAGSHLVRSDLGWNKLQSIYGLLRYLGAPAVAAWIAQALICVVGALCVILCWRSRNIPFALKAAQLAATVPFVTPYILYYDVPVLAVTIAFLFRQRSFDRIEYSVIAPCTLCLFLPFFVNVPSALLATVPAAALVIRRIVLSGAGNLAWMRLAGLRTSGEARHATQAIAARFAAERNPGDG